MRRIVLVCLAICGIVACNSNTSPDLTPYAGNYVLRTVNDTLLPYRVNVVADTTIDIVADTIFMGVNGEFLDVTHYRQTVGTVITLPLNQLSGSWTVDGTTVTFDAVSGDVFSGNLNGSTITLVGSTAKAVYTK